MFECGFAGGGTISTLQEVLQMSNRFLSKRRVRRVTVPPPLRALAGVDFLPVHRNKVTQHRGYGKRNAPLVPVVVV